MESRLEWTTAQTLYIRTMVEQLEVTEVREMFATQSSLIGSWARVMALHYTLPDETSATKLIGKNQHSRLAVSWFPVRNHPR